MRLRTALLLLILILVGAAPAAEAKPRAAKRIHAFASCPALIDYAKAHAPKLVPPRSPEPWLIREAPTADSERPARGRTRRRPTCRRPVSTSRTA